MKKILNQSEVAKISLIVLLLVLVILLYDWPILKRINEFYDALEAEVAALEAQNEQGNSFTKASLDWQQFSAKLPTSAQLLQPSGQELELIKLLEQQAEKNHLTQELTLGQNRRDWSPKIEVLGLSAKLTGNYSDIINYLENLEKLNFQLTVDSVIIKPATNLSAEAADQVAADLLLNTYWLKQ